VGRIWAGLAGLLLAALVPIGVSVPAHAATEGVSVGDGSPEFSPGQVTVRVGDTVRWTNTSLINWHNVQSSGGWSFAGDLAPVVSPDSSSASFTFASPGSYAYICRFHPAMAGAVVVTGGGSTPSRAPTRAPAPPPKPTASRAPTPSPSAATPTPVATTPPGSPAPTRVAARAKPLPTASRRAPAAAAPKRPDARRGLLHGLTAPDPTGRERGLPALVAFTMLVGVGSAHVRVRRLLPAANGRHRKLSPDRPRRRRSVGRRT
jgi:plastocyanin